MFSTPTPPANHSQLPAWFHVGRCLARILDAFCFLLTLHGDVKKNSLTTTNAEELCFSYVCVRTCYCVCSMWKPEANAGRLPRCLSILAETGLRQVPSLNLDPTDCASWPAASGNLVSLASSQCDSRFTLLGLGCTGTLG